MCVAYLVAGNAPAEAATQVVTLSVPGMTCAACPITVQKALSTIAGVEKISVNLEGREVTVTFDDARTGVKALAQATTNAGYPSSVKR